MSHNEDIYKELKDIYREFAGDEAADEIGTEDIQKIIEGYADATQLFLLLEPLMDIAVTGSEEVTAAYHALLMKTLMSAEVESGGMTHEEQDQLARELADLMVRRDANGIIATFFGALVATGYALAVKDVLVGDLNIEETYRTTKEGPTRWN